MTTAIHPQHWSERIGAVYTAGELPGRLAADERAPLTVEGAVASHCAGELVAFRTADGELAFPGSPVRQGRPLGGQPRRRCPVAAVAS